MIYRNNSYEVIQEGATPNKNPSAVFYTEAEEFLDGIHKILKNKETHPIKTLLQKENKFIDQKSYKKSFEKCKNSIEAAKSKSKSIIDFDITLRDLRLTYTRDVDDLANELMSLIKSKGYALNPKSKNILKKLFVSRVMYKVVDKDLAIILKYSINYTSTYNIPQNFVNLTMKLSAVVPDEKTQKYLNVLESYDNKDIDLEGFFESVKFI